MKSGYFVKNFFLQRVVTIFSLTEEACEEDKEVKSRIECMRSIWKHMKEVK